MRPIKFVLQSLTYHLGFRMTENTISTSSTSIGDFWQLTVAIKVFLFGVLTTLFNFHTPDVLPAAQVEVSLNLNYPLSPSDSPTSLIFGIDVNMAGVGIVDGALDGEEVIRDY
jgi:hypothetical protein